MYRLRLFLDKTERAFENPKKQQFRQKNTNFSRKKLTKNIAIKKRIKYNELHGGEKWGKVWRKWRKGKAR